MRPPIWRILLIFSPVLFLAGCTRDDNATDMVPTTVVTPAPQDTTAADAPSLVDTEPAALHEPPETILPEITEEPAREVEEPETVSEAPPSEAFMTTESATEPEEAEAPPVSTAEASPQAEDSAEAPTESGNTRPLLTREVISTFAYLEMKKENADELLFRHLSNMAAAYNLRGTDQETYQYITDFIDGLQGSKLDNPKQIDAPVTIDMKIGRPMTGHRLYGTALPSMRLGLLKYMIDRLQESDEFDFDNWLDKTKAIEKKLVAAVDGLVENDQFEPLLKELDGAADMWEYTNSRLQGTRRNLKYGYSVNPTGHITLHRFGGISGLSKRAGTAAALVHNLERLDDWRRAYEFAKLNIDLLMGEMFHNVLSESEREHLEHMWDAQVLLSPKQFYRIRWQSQYATDLKLSELDNAIINSRGDPDPGLYVARAMLFAKKSSHPYMVYSDLRKATDLDPEMQFDEETQQALKAAVKMVDEEDDAYIPSRMMDLYIDSLRIVDGLDGD